MNVVMQAFSKHGISTNLGERFQYSTFVIGSLDYFSVWWEALSFLLTLPSTYWNESGWYLSLDSVPSTEFCIIKLHSPVGV